jgi:type VI secretion system secreted protein Hcp
MKKAGAAALAAAFVAAVAGAIAWAGDGGPAAVHACVAEGSGLVRVPAAGEACRRNETALDWNVQGPQGPAGPQGEPGEQGPAGPGGGGANEPNTRVVGFLRVDSTDGAIDGEATAKGHEQWIDVLGFDGDAVAPVTIGSGGGAGKVDLKPIVNTKPIDKSTPKLFEALVTGRHLPDVQLDVVRTDDKGAQETFYSVKLETVTVSEIPQLDEGKAGGRPLEQVTFDYQRIELREGDGAASGGAGPAG